MKLNGVWYLQVVGGARGNPPIAGGGVQHLLGTSKSFSELGIPVFLITNSADTTSKDFTSHFGKRFELKSIGGSEKSLVFELLNIFTSMRLLISLKKQIPDLSIIISASPFLPDVIGTVLLSARRRILPVFSVHHVNPPPWRFTSRRGGLFRTLVIWLQQLLVFYIALTVSAPIVINYTQKEQLLRSYPSLRVVTDYGFLDPYPSCKRGRNDLDSWDAVFVGRPSRQKGFYDLVEAWAFVNQVNVKRRLALVIPNVPRKQRAAIEILIKQFNLENVISIFEGISNTERDEIISSSRLLAFPSYEEGWALTVMECAALETPIVTYDLAAYSYLGDCILKVPVGDVGALICAFESVWDGTINLDKSIKQARNQVIKYDRKNLGKIQLSEYLSLISERFE